MHLEFLFSLVLAAVAGHNTKRLTLIFTLMAHLLKRCGEIIGGVLELRTGGLHVD